MYAVVLIADRLIRYFTRNSTRTRIRDRLSLRCGQRESGNSTSILKASFVRSTTIVLIAVVRSVALAQEMEPRAYSRAPVGTQFVLFSFSHQTGDVLLDASLPLRDVSVKFNGVSVAYGRTFDLAGNQANIAIALPYIKGSAKGTLFEEQQEARRSGLGDARLRFSTNLIGGPALNPKEFAAYKAKALLGVSLSVVAPTGQYDPRRLINPGSNRWAFKPEMGLSKPFGRWTLELVGGIWFFKSNNNFFGGVKREQKPLTSLQAHLLYTLRPRMWLSVNGTYYAGGRTVVDGVINEDVQRNSRIGATFSLPVTQRQSIKVVWANGLTARFGGDLTTIGVAWQYTWF